MIPIAKDWAIMRAAVTAYYPDPISIYTVIKTRDRYGTETKSYTLLTTVSGQLSEASGSERQLLSTLINQGTENIEAMKLHLPYSTTIAVAHEVATADGKYWNVTMTNSSQTFTAAREVLLYRHIVNGGLVNNG